MTRYHVTTCTQYMCTNVFIDSHYVDMVFVSCSCRELSRYERDQSFPEKKGYTPHVKLEYVDDKGHLLSTKEVKHASSDLTHLIQWLRFLFLY